MNFNIKRAFLLLFVIGYSVHSFAQKPSIDTSILGKWAYVSNPAISNNGNYISYTIENKPLGSQTLVIKSTSNSWEKEYVGGIFGFFSGDNQQIIFQISDTLFFLSLGTQNKSCVFNVNSYKEPRSNKTQWLAYQLRNSKELVLIDLYTAKEKRFSDIVNYSFNANGNALLIESESSQNGTALEWVSLTTGNPIMIWSNQESSPRGSIIDRYSFNEEGNELAFIVKEIRNGRSENTIWYYKVGMNNAIIRVSNQSSGISTNFLVNGSPQFSKNGRWIFFQLEDRQKESRTLNRDAVNVDIWSYKDIVLQPEQIRQLTKGPRTFMAAVSVDSNHVIRLERDDEKIQTVPELVTGDYIVIADNFSVGYWWKYSPQPSFYLLSLKDGSRRLLKSENCIIYNFSFSPQGRYIVYYHFRQKAYFSYDIKSGKTRNITRSISSGIDNEYSRGVNSIPVAPIAGWFESDSSLLLYDNYDIWKVDPSSVKSPINLTNGYGSSHHVKLRLVYDKDVLYRDIVYSGNESLLLTGFNSLNKYNGFYQKLLNKKGNPELLTMGPYTFYHKGSQLPVENEINSGMQPIKANDVNSSIVMRQTASEAPNYFFTKDFKTYIALSDLQPQSDYNWLTAEIVSWKQLDGTVSQGILYKPEDFDSHKKYPVIFNYYEQLSHRLYEFPEPEFTRHNINIPWFVSNGYIVFTPDIHYDVASTSGKTVGEWAYNSVVSAAKYLSKRPYVNAQKMGLQGHSFGGLETNYLITHTHLFTAAAEAAGSSDPISAYLTLIALQDGRSIESFSRQMGVEIGHELYGATPWQRPDLYRKNSAVLSADQTTTPLLIMHNKFDNQVQWRQGIELYMALRRLGKKVWMLQYDEGTHGVFGRDAVDYTIRLTQFFNYYLKGAPPPIWMTEGLPARLKGIETGYGLDTSGKIP